MPRVGSWSKRRIPKGSFPRDSSLKGGGVGLCLGMNAQERELGYFPRNSQAYLVISHSGHLRHWRGYRRGSRNPPRTVISFPSSVFNEESSLSFLLFLLFRNDSIALVSISAPRNNFLSLSESVGVANTNYHRRVTQTAHVYPSQFWRLGVQDQGARRSGVW